MTIVSHAWKFGDGATSTDANPTHEYSKDGTYQVKLTVTTQDGRSASTTQPVSVKTHDVAIIDLQAPDAGHTGRPAR